MKKTLRIAWLIALAASAPAHAEPTEVAVRVISADGKFIGDSMGGAKVTLRDAQSGRVLARGTTRGGTGNTARIMQATGRSPLIATPDAAAFVSQINIDEPRLVNLEVSGPVGHPGSMIRVVSQRWVMPGQPVNLGDGWVVELPGLAITPTVRIIGRNPGTKQRIAAVSAKVELLCGCPITPGGQWNADDYQVTVSLWQRRYRVSEAPLAFVAAPGGFAGDIAIPAKGRFRMFVHARNIVTGNSGITELTMRTSQDAVKRGSERS